MSAILEHPAAQALLDDATVYPATIVGCRARLARFLERYLPLFYRREQRELAVVVLQGRLSGLSRKTSEPIAVQAGRPRKPVQHFVGAGRWDDAALLAELRRHVGEVLGDPAAVLVVDGSTFPKKGTASCGVQRQWCGRLGKKENCQAGVFLAYAAPDGHAPLDHRLYLPKQWAKDKRRRQSCHVPAAVVFQEKWRLALEQLDRCRAALPHGWVTADDEFGRVRTFRARLRDWGERYVLDVPCNSLVRDLDEPPPPSKRRCGRRRKAPFRRADDWAAQVPAARWQRLAVRPGEKGPLLVDAVEGRVQTKGADGRLGPQERLVALRRGAGAKLVYALSNAPPEVPLAAVVAAHAERHRIEEVLEEGKGEVGLGQYEVRSWPGWHHQMTLGWLALWFLALERYRVGEKKTGGDGAATARDLQPAVAATAAAPRADRGGDQPGAAADRGGAHLPLVRRHRHLPAAPRHSRRPRGDAGGPPARTAVAKRLQ